MSVPGRWARHFGGYEITESEIRKLKFWQLPHQALLRILVSSSSCPRLEEETGSERAGNLPEVMQPVHGRTRTWNHISLSPKLAFSSGKAWRYFLTQYLVPHPPSRGSQSHIGHHISQCLVPWSVFFSLTPFEPTSCHLWAQLWGSLQLGLASFLFPLPCTQRACLNPSPFWCLNCPRMPTGIPSLASKAINKIISVYIATCDNS